MRNVSAKVISVGNVSYGGSGKTPIIDMLLQDLPGKLGYVSRGYRRKKRGLYVTTSSCCDYERSGDEAMQLASHHSGMQLAICESKWKGLSAIEKMCDFVIVDDGLQRYDLPIHIQVATVSAFSPYGSPSGLLREPFSRLKGVDLIVVTDAQMATPALKAKLRSFKRPTLWTSPVLKTFFRPDGSPVEFMKGQKMALFSGIANPGRFFRSIESLGYTIVDHLQGADHKVHDKQRLRSWIGLVMDQHPTVVFVGTEKDFVRQKDWEGLPVFFARMELCIVDGREEYEEFLMKIQGTT
jgi:tetraacyldisaccharide 4'-kinase